MATTQEAIARLRMIFETQGADAAAAEMKKLEASTTSLGTSSLNLDRAFTGLERRYSETARATAEYERSMRTLNAAVAQNPALAERAAAVQQTITARYQATMQAAQQAAHAQTALGQVNQAAQSQMQGLAASTGLLGSTLSTLGRAGTVAAVGIGGLYLGFQKLDEGVTRTAQYARDLKNFSEATGLSTAQVQGLNKEASKFGIDIDQLHGGLLRFTAGIEELKQGSGSLLTSIRGVDSGLADQMQNARGEAEALGLLAQAVQRAGNEFQRAQIARAAFGRQGLGLLPLLQSLDVGDIAQKFSAKGLSESVINEMNKLQSAIDALGTSIDKKIYASFGESWLKSKLSFLEYVDAVVKNIGKVNETAKENRAVEEINAQSNAVKDLQTYVDRLQKSVDESGGAMGRLFGGPQAAALDTYKEKLKQANAELDKLLEERTNKALPLPAQAPDLLPASSGQSIDDLKKTINAYKELQSAIGNLIPVQQQVAAEAARLELAARTGPSEYKAQIEQATAALLALKTVQAEMSQVAPGTYERQLEQIQAMKAEYPGLVAQDAIRLAEMQAQLRVAQAVTGVQRMQAQEQATYVQLVRQGVAPELAMTMAKKQTAIAQAQINAQAQQQLLSLRNQAGVAAAVTGEEKIRAQQIATINSLLQQGVDLETATAIAARERANAEATVNAQVQQQVFKLNESTELIRAQIKDLQAQAGQAQTILGINEMNVRTQQAFNDAIRQGASDEAASAVAAATYNNLLAQRAMQIAQINAQQLQQQQSPRDSGVGGDNKGALPGQEFLPARTGLLPGAGQVLSEIESYAQAGSAAARQFLASESAGGMLASRDLSELVAKMKQEAALGPILQQYQQTQDQALQQLVSLQNQGRLGAAGTPQEKAQIQAQITYEDLIKQGVASDLAHQIANQELANAMQDLAKSVDANTSALQDQLDPIYTEGRAALRIGYYGEGSGGTMRTVTGTGYANDNTGRAAGGDVYAGRAYMIGERGPELFVPGASGTIVPNAALQGGANAAQSGNVVIINNNFPPGAVMGDRRTQYQAANSYGRAVAAMGA
jgi:hypothetical protein